MIQNYVDAETENIWNGVFSKKLPPEIQNLARRKLRMLNNAGTIEDLKQPPCNQLEQLKGNRKGQFSIHINKQWRICFRWKEGQVNSVEITDYH